MVMFLFWAVGAPARGLRRHAKILRRRIARAEGLASASCCFIERERGASARTQADEQREVVGHDRRPDVGLEVVETAPRAADQTIGPLETGDARLDPSAEVAQLAI